MHTVYVMLMMQLLRPKQQSSDEKVYLASCIDTYMLPFEMMMMKTVGTRRWSNKPDVVGSIPVTTEFLSISCYSNQVPKWFGTH